MNDCETQADWTLSDSGTFDRAVGATGKRVGSNCLKLTSTAATDNSQYVQTVVIDESVILPLGPNGHKQQDWTDTAYIGFWTHAEDSAEYGADGEMKWALVNDGTVSAKQDITGIVGTEHQWMQIDISGLPRDKVEAIRFYSNNPATAEDLYIDNIIRYKYELGGAPVFGCYYYITSGTTLTEAEGVKWTIDGLAAASATETVSDLGPAILGASTLLGTAARNKYGMIPGKFILMVKASGSTTAGEGLQSSAANTYKDADSGSMEHSPLKGLEAAGAASDWIFAIYDTAGQQI
ncbi:MAG TPA: hypothetical protein ENH87_01885 [Pricia antarctica]|uniref:Uncharacterized protein n=1 Tax=Pricia antarctica TaxID=641691 RepID=A0A831VMD9_9FLAO|nr:hypothetical protein [Pricia antarctica]